MKNKIRLVFVFALVFGLCFALGFFDVVNVNNENRENNKSVISNPIDYGTVTSTIQNFNIESLSSYTPNEKNSAEKDNDISDIALSSDDMAVKNEILKHCDTKIDFRYKKQETISNNKFDITFSKIDSLNNCERIIYVNEYKDEFAYNIYNGKLVYAIVKSVATEKNEQSIDKDIALKIANEYVTEKCDIKNYKLDLYKEIDTGYYFSYTRYVGEYPSIDRYSIQIGYDGNIVYVSDFTDTFDSKELNYSKEFIDSKIKEYSDETKVDWNSITICIHEGKVAVKYTEPEQCAIAILPLE